jgi:hypothetical protein
MSVIEAFIWVAMFFGIYGSMVVLGWLIDKWLRKSFGRGIFPKGYFS